MKVLNKFILFIVALVISMTGCDTEELHELNINPQAVNEIDLNYLFSAAQLGIASNGSSGDNRYIDWRTNIGLCAGAVQQLSTPGSISSVGNFYTHNEETAAAPFEFTYNDQLKNIAEVLKQTGPGGYSEGQLINTRNAARILKAWSFQRLTDFYGAVPYTEANQGIEGIFFPAYDNQSVIYPDLLNELDEATAALSTANPDHGFADADMIYQGDIEKWKKWGYSLMLRLAMRVSNVDAALADTYVTKAVAGGVFTSNDDNVWIPMALGPSEWTNQNGISRAFFPGDGGNQSYLSETLIDWLKGADPGTTDDDDPRLMILSGGIFDWTPSGTTFYSTDPLEQRGIPPGHSQSDIEAIEGGPVILQETFSRINHLMLDDDDPYMIMTYAEVEFLLAEALERGIGSGISGGDAQAHYEAGVRAAMHQLTPYFDNNDGVDGDVDGSDIDDYLATYPYTGTLDQRLEMIGEQMWVSKFFNWWEAWCDWRRTGYPQLTPFTTNESNVTGGTIPVRLQYPSTETTLNPNFDQQNYNDYTSPVWWDGGTE